MHLTAFWGEKEKRSYHVRAWQRGPFSGLRSSESCLTRSECLVLGSISEVGEESQGRALLVGKEFSEERPKA